MEESSSGKVIRLDKDDIRQISTSQVIASIAGGCRELIDNALDAGATSIEIRSSEFGTKQLEVIDNGHGIASSNFHALCKPHSTSKLSRFEDFDNLLTFGFRGEALNALAALSDLTVITQHKSESKATKLKFNHDGDIVEQSICARSVGTTVIMANLFERLPVRRKQFLATARDEFQKLLNSVQAFALSRTDVRFIVKNMIGSKTNQMLATQGGNANLKSVITTVFGARAEKESMLEIKDAMPDSEVLDHFGLPQSSVSDDDNVYKMISVRGYVSSCEFGCGRYASDRQFIFINGRPVDYSKMCKTVNEVYSSFNRGHYCTLILFIDIDPENVDPNLTPDKRQVFLRIEKETFAKLRACLLETFQAVVSKCPVSNTVQDKQQELKLKHKSTENNDVDSQAISSSVQSKQTVLQPLSSMALQSKSKVSVLESPTINVSKKSSTTKRKSTDSDNSIGQFQITQMTATRDGNLQSQIFNFGNYGLLKAQKKPTVSKFARATDFMKTSDLIEEEEEPVEKRTRVSTESMKFEQPNQSLTPNRNSSMEIVERRAFPDKITEVCLDTSQSSVDPFNTTTTSIDEHADCHSTIKPSTHMFEHTQAGDVERNLSLMLRKEDFESMLVVGQFNKAFILTRLGDNMFIIDQHASDEKYNFERLQEIHKVECQSLIAPKPLKVGAVYESVIHDNLDIFRANGFDFIFDENELPGNRLKLISSPSVRGYIFNDSDIEEIAGVLNAYPGVMYRPEKTRKIFASWSCRKSIMIGRALKHYEMVRVVRNMGKIENPWNCPHGRPTIRHLCTLQFSLKMSQIFEALPITADESDDAIDAENSTIEQFDQTIEDSSVEPQPHSTDYEPQIF